MISSSPTPEFFKKDLSLPEPFVAIRDFLAAQKPIDLSANDHLSNNNFDLPKVAVKKISELVKNFGLNILIENPFRWMNQTPNSEFVRTLFSNIQMSLSVLGLDYKVESIGGPADSFNPRIARSNEILFSFHSADLDQAYNPRIIRMKESYLPPYFTFDPTGFSGWASLANCSLQTMYGLISQMNGPESFEFRSALCTKMNQGLSKYIQPESQSLGIEQPYVFYPMQIATDRVMKLAQIQTLELLDLLVQSARETGTKLVVKRHPRCGVTETKDRIDALIAQNDPLIIISDAAVSDLIRGAQSVVVVNSGVGMETLIHGKPLYSTGHSDYHWLSNKIESLDCLRQAFDNPQSATDLITEAQFINYYFNHYCVNPLNPRQIQRKVFDLISDWITVNYH